MYKDNQFAQLLKAQGQHVVEVDSIDWYRYQGFMTPAYLPHSTPSISKETAKKVLKITGCPFVRWNTDFGIDQQTEWWYILKKGEWSIEHMKSKKKRWMIRQGRKNFQVRPITDEEVLKKCPTVAKFAAERYQGAKCVEDANVLLNRVESMKKVPGALEFIGCFKDNTMVSYSENYIQDNAVWLSVIRHDPEYLKEYSSYALIDGILDYYLNVVKLDYVLDGSRSIHHRTGFQDHLENVFGFEREYSRINIVYSRLFAGLVKMVYPFRGAFFRIHAKWINRFTDNVCAIIQQESIRRSCEHLAVNIDSGN